MLACDCFLFGFFAIRQEGADQRRDGHGDRELPCPHAPLLIGGADCRGSGDPRGVAVRIGDFRAAPTTIRRRSRRGDSHRLSLFPLIRRKEPFVLKTRAIRCRIATTDRCAAKCGAARRPGAANQTAEEDGVLGVVPDEPRAIDEIRIVEKDLGELVFSR